MQVISFNPNILNKFFNIKVREACKSCKRYSFKNCCPPMIEDIDYYQKLLPNYKKGLIIYEKFKLKDYTQSTWQELGIYSSIKIHNYLLKKRNQLFQNGFVFNLALTAGSCKLCSKCNIPCSHPDKMLIPIEGTGIDVIKLMKYFNIQVRFPIKKQGYFLRIGMILWK